MPLIVSGAAATLVCVLAGPFGTTSLPVPGRTLFWGVLIGINAAKWRLWYAYVPDRLSRWLPPGARRHVLTALSGAVVLNALLPLEIRWLFLAVGKPIVLPFGGLFIVASVIALAISAVAMVLGQQGQPVAVTAEPATAPPPIPAVPRAGLAARADLSALLAVTAEDHYLRLHMVDGQRPLILYRFGDALAELAAIDGQQLHRGAWVAARGVAGAARDGRRWQLRLPDGTTLPVSETYLPAVRRRGWLSRI